MSEMLMDAGSNDIRLAGADCWCGRPRVNEASCEVKRPLPELAKSCSRNANSSLSRRARSRCR